MCTDVDCTHSLRKLLTSFLFKVLTFCWLSSLLPLGVMASSTFSLLGKENVCEDFLRNLSELRGVCKCVVLNCSLRHSSFSSLSLLELFVRFLDDLVFLSSSSESEDKRDRFKLRRFFVNQFGGSSLSSSLDAPMLSRYRICYPQCRINLAGKLQFDFAHEQCCILKWQKRIFSPWKCHTRHMVQDDNMAENEIREKKTLWTTLSLSQSNWSFCRKYTLHATFESLKRTVTFSNKNETNPKQNNIVPEACNRRFFFARVQ